jgi:hypothetical protein
MLLQPARGREGWMVDNGYLSDSCCFLGVLLHACGMASRVMLLSGTAWDPRLVDRSACEIKIASADQF